MSVTTSPTTVAIAQPVNHRKITKQFKEFAEEVVNIVPHLSKVVVNRHNLNYLHGNVVREMVENLLLDTPLNPREFVETHILSGKCAVNIVVGSSRYADQLFNFFRSVSLDGALIETTMRSSTQLSIDVNTCNIKDIMYGQYFVYLPIKADDGSSFVVFDILFDSPHHHYFTIHQLVYPFASTTYDITLIYSAIIDISLKHITSIATEHFSQQLLEASQLYAKGYRFYNDGLVQRIFGAVVKYLEGNDDLKYYIRNDEETIRPSGVVGQVPGIIVKTLHKNVTFSNIGELYNHTSIMNMLKSTPLPLESWKLPDSGSGYGVTMSNITVYKGARCHMFVGKKITVEDIMDKNLTSLVLLVELEIPAFTRFHRGFDSGLLKFRFEKAIVKKFYSYPKRPIESNITVVSDYDQNFSYRIGDTVVPDNGSFYSYREETCQTGIHAFLDVNSVWSYFHSSHILLDYAETVVTLNVLTTNDQYDDEDE